MLLDDFITELLIFFTLKCQGTIRDRTFLLGRKTLQQIEN